MGSTCTSLHMHFPRPLSKLQRPALSVALSTTAILNLTSPPPSTATHSKKQPTTKTMPPKLSVPAFAKTQLALLKNEQECEIADSSALISTHAPTSLQRAGLAVTNLVINSQRTGLGGKTVLELGPDAAIGEELGEHGVRVGDVVIVSGQPGGSAKKREVRELEEKGVRGVVIKVGKGTIAVAAGEGNDEVPAGRVWIVKVADDVTHRR